MSDQTDTVSAIMLVGSEDRVVTKDNPLIINQPAPSYGTVGIQAGGDILTQVETTVTIGKLVRDPDPTA
jgi:hypothetical protein